MAVTEKRPLDETVYGSNHIVMDIEGTTTSIGFVKDTLFPYVRQNLEGYVNSHLEEDEFLGVLALLKDQAAEDKKANMEGAVEIPSDAANEDLKAAIVKNVLWQMDSDRKTSALKKLQGHMWRQGYKTGELKGHLFADVAPALKEWVKDGRKLYIYSSGSVEAQKLLFGNSNDGDLTELFTDFFDTEVGPKVEAGSYKSILKKLDCKADDVLFLTDLPKEASAAREAGLPVMLVEREGNAPIAGDVRKEFTAVSSFQDISFEKIQKKQKVASDSEEGDKQENGMNGKSNGQSNEAMEVDPEDKHDKAEVKETEELASKDEKMIIDDPKVDSKVEDKVEKVASDSVSSPTEVLLEKEHVKEKPVEGDTEKAVEIPEKVEDEVTAAIKKPSDQPQDVPSTEEVKEEGKPTGANTSESVPEQPDKASNNSTEAVENDTQKTDEKTPPLKTEEETEIVPAQDSGNQETDLKNSTSKDDLKTDVDSNDRDVKESKLVEPEIDSKLEENEKVIGEDKTEKDEEVKVEKVSEVTDADKSERETEAKEVEVSETPEAKEVTPVPEKSEPKVAEIETEKESPKPEDALGNTPGTEETKEIGSDEKVEKKEEVNGVSNGTNGKESVGDKVDTNGTIENGKADIPEVIVAKNTPQIDNNSADGVVVEA